MSFGRASDISHQDAVVVRERSATNLSLPHRATDLAEQLTGNPLDLKFSGYSKVAYSFIEYKTLRKYRHNLILSGK